MSKITFEKKKDRITIINRLTYPETVNERVNNAIAAGMYEGFLPVSIRRKWKETQVECVIQGLIPLGQYFGGIVTRNMFLDFVHEIALLVKLCEKNMINANNLDLQTDKIFIDPYTKSIKCIFWPVVNNQRGNPPHLFLKQLPFELQFNPLEDNGYLETYKAFFDGVTPFSVNNFDKMVLMLSGKKTAEDYTVLTGPLMNSLGDNGHSEENDVNEKRKTGIEYDPFADQYEDSKNHKEGQKIDDEENAVFCSSCGTKNQSGSNFCIQCGETLQKEAPPEPEWNGNDDSGDYDMMILGDDYSGTTVLGYEDAEEPVYPTLTRLKTNESYLVNKSILKIGSGKHSSDVYIGDNHYISRSHADIVTHENRYFIVDQKSTNKTYVDGTVVPAGKEIELFPGTKIRLANEDFIFNIEF